MKVITLDEHTPKEEVAAAIGFFDGVHKAHQTLIHTMKHQAHKKGLKSAVITFDKHPKSVLQSIDYKYITPLSRKIKKIESYDVDILYLIRFDREKAAMDPQAFIDHYLKNVRVLVCGFDFTFGYKASGTKDLLLKQTRFKTIVLDKQTHHGDKIGSTAGMNPVTLDMAVIATSRVFSVIIDMRSSSTKVPSVGSAGINLSVAPVRSAICCHGTKFA